ncbi:MAG: hypothetical protein WB611_15050 [Stellaceae bacterium]
MSAAYSTIKSPQRVVARFLLEYYKIWGKYFPGLNKRAHWHVIFMARTCDEGGVSSRAIHRTLYGSYGTDIRTCIERIKDCERDGFIRVFDPGNQSCVASAGCLVGPTEQLFESFDAHCRDTIAEICATIDDKAVGFDNELMCDDRLISEIYRFFGAYDQKWRETTERVVKQKGLTPAHVEDAMDHLVTYQYWAIVMLLWSASAFGSERIGAEALVIDEIISRMWDQLQLGHLAIKERVANLIRWGFFDERTIKKHKAVSLTPVAGDAINAGLTATRPLLINLYERLIPEARTTASTQVV